jgi:putative ABC transport system permease protein
VTILGHPFTVAGLTSGTSAILYSIAFISVDDFARLRGSRNTVSYVWVRAAPGVTPEALGSRIERAIPAVTAQTRQEFAAQERRVVNTMSTDVINIMNLVGFLIGLAVVAITVYTATLSRRAEYGVLKAVGARNTDLYRVVLSQAFLSVALGLVLGVAFTLLLSVIVPTLVVGLFPSVSSGSLLKAGAMALIIAGFSAVLPIKQIAGVDPARVFKGASR